MNFVGFIPFHHQVNDNAGRCSPSFINMEYTDSDKSIFLDFFENRGKYFAVTMTAVESIFEKKIIGGLGYLTNGDWIWPSYSLYYIKHHNMFLPENFRNYIKNEDNQMRLVPDDSRIIEAGIFFKQYFEEYLTTLKRFY